MTVFEDKVEILEWFPLDYRLLYQYKISTLVLSQNLVDLHHD